MKLNCGVATHPVSASIYKVGTMIELGSGSEIVCTQGLPLCPALPECSPWSSLLVVMDRNVLMVTALLVPPLACTAQLSCWLGHQHDGLLLDPSFCLCTEN